MKVTVVAVYGSDLTIANAARVSFAKHKDTFDDADARLLAYLARHQHWSPFRHVFLQLHIHCPEFVARQLYKHVVGIAATTACPTPDHAWNEVSGRYVSLTNVYQPPEMSWRQAPQRAKQGSGDLIASRDTQLKADVWYQEAMQKSLSTYRLMLGAGIAPEQARMVLPMSFMTEFYWTASFQAVMNVVRLRTAPDAQQEIRQLAERIRDEVAKAFPAAYRAFSRT